MELDAVDPTEMRPRQLDHEAAPVAILTPTLLEGVFAYLRQHAPPPTRPRAISDGAYHGTQNTAALRLEKCNRQGETSLFVFTRRHAHAPDWQARVTVTVDCARRCILKSRSTGYQPAPRDDGFFNAEDVTTDGAAGGGSGVTERMGGHRAAESRRGGGVVGMAGGQVKAPFRALNHNGRPIPIAAPTLLEGVAGYLRAHAGEYGLPDGIFDRLAIEGDAGLLVGRASFRLEHRKTVMDNTVFVFAQTYAGLPIWQAAVTVTVNARHRRILSSSSTAYDLVELTDPPLDMSHPALSPHALLRALGEDGDDVDGHGCIESERLIVYRYEPAQRGLGELPGRRERNEAAHEQDFALALPPVPNDMVDGGFYVVREVLFTHRFHGTPLYWRALVELRTGAVLYVRAFASGVRGELAQGGRDLPCAAEPASLAALDALRDSVTPAGLSAMPDGLLALRTELVQLRPENLPEQLLGSEADAFELSYDAESVRIGASNAYDHCDDFFRMVLEMGFSDSYFGATAFPVPIEHRGFGGTGLHINAHCMGSPRGIASVDFAFADLPELTHPLGFAADRHVVLHELGGHGVLYPHIGAANFGFAHSAGDAIGAILCDPDSRAADRFMSYPWVDIGRRHDREPEAGWGWASEAAAKPFSPAHDRGGYRTEQILSTTLFRLYRAIGGDSPRLAARREAARTTVYLVLHAIGSLTPCTNPRRAEAFELALETADASDWVREEQAPSQAGGVYWKTIRWAFEQQGMFQPPGTALPADRGGAPPPVDVYIDDGRHGEYGFQQEPAQCLDIWNRQTPALGTEDLEDRRHEAPVIGRTNYAYVRIRNRGTEAAANIVVRGFQGDADGALNFPSDWRRMATPALAAADLAAGDRDGVVVGPFAWVPDDVAGQAMLFSVAAAGDPSNIDGRVAGPVSAGRLVPHDNNLAQRNVTPVPPDGESAAAPARAGARRLTWSAARPLRETLDVVFGLGDDDGLLV